MASSVDTIFRVDLKRTIRRMQDGETGGLSLSETKVKRKKDKKEGKVSLDTFTGKQMVDWLVNSSQEASLKDRVAAVRVAQHFLTTKEIASVQTWAEGASESRFGVEVKFVDSSDALYFFQTEQLPETIHEILSRSPYQTIAEVMKNVADSSTGISVRDRKSHFKKLRDCFIAQELTAWVMNHLQTHTRDDAITFCLFLEKAGWIRSTDGKSKSFADKEINFQLVKTPAELAAYALPISSNQLSSSGPGGGVVQPSSVPSPIIAGSSGGSSGSLVLTDSGYSSSPPSTPPPRPNRERVYSITGSYAHPGLDHGSDEDSPVVRSQSDLLLAPTRQRNSGLSSSPLCASAFPEVASQPTESASTDQDSQSTSSTVDGDLLRHQSRESAPGMSVIGGGGEHDENYNASASNISSSSSSSSPYTNSCSNLDFLIEEALSDQQPVDVIRGNAMSEVIRAEMQFATELKNYIDRVVSTHPPNIAESIIGNMTEQLRFHLDFVRSLENCTWQDAYDTESAALARKLKNGVNPLDVSAKMLRNESGSTIPEEEERSRRAQTPAEHHSALHLAADKCDLNALLSLIEEHPQMVIASDSKLWTPLHSACASGHIGIVDALLRAGAKTTALTNESVLPLHLFVRHSYTPSRLWSSVLKRLRKDVDINHQTSTGETALHYAALSEDTEDNIHWLVRRGADLDRPNLRGNTPLHNAIIQGRSRTVRFLLCCGASQLPCGTMPIAQLVKRNSPVATILSNWTSIFTWWVSFRRVLQPAIRRMKLLLRFHICNYSRALAAIAAYNVDPSNSAWLTQGLAMPSRHLRQLLVALKTAVGHDSRNEFVLEDIHDLIDRLADFSELTTLFTDGMHRAHRTLFEVVLSLAKEQRKNNIKFSLRYTVENPETLLLTAPFQLHLVQSSPPLPTYLPKSRTVEQMGSEIPVVAFLFSSRLFITTGGHDGERTLLICVDRDKICFDKYLKSPHNTLSVTILRIPNLSENQPRFRLVAVDADQDIDQWIEHTAESNSKIALNNPIIQF